jgi:hypothetical protein
MSRKSLFLVAGLLVLSGLNVALVVFPEESDAVWQLAWGGGRRASMVGDGVIMLAVGGGGR